MKKVLILMLVLGMTSLASAGIVVVTPDMVSGSIETDPIDVEVVQQAFFMGITGAGAISNETLVYTGNLSAITDFTGMDAGLTAGIDAAIAAYAPGAGLVGGATTQILMIELFDGTSPPGTPPPVVGQLVTFDAGDVEAYLLDADNLGVFSAVAIPEPITFALLGLGGLFLRRRK